MRRLSILVTIFLTTTAATFGAVIVEHVGANDPATEGWTLTDNSGGHHIYGPVFNDLGSTDSWRLDTLSNGSSGDLDYWRSLSQTELAESLSGGWALTAVIRLIEAAPSTMVMAFLTGTRNYNLVLSGTPADADPVLELQGHSAITLTGGGGAYHTYRMIDDNADGVCSVFVDGELIADDYAGWAYQWDNGLLEFGDVINSSTRNGHALYAQVTFEILPEPSTVLLLLTAAIFILHRREAC